MQEVNLFYDAQGKWVSKRQIQETLCELGAEKCDTLFIHTALNFGTPNPDIKKSVLLSALLDCIKSLGVRNILMPTFTFSFCNNLVYDVNRSVSRMGVLNEFFRKQDGVIRSVDPLMSVALLGEDTDLVRNIGHYSCGACSTYDKLRHSSDVHFLMFGPQIGECMTYMHYLEWLYSVDYRYDRLFSGEVVSDGILQHEEYVLFSRYKGVTPSRGTFEFENRMYNHGTAKRINVGNAGISLVSEKNAAIEYKKCLEENPYFFVDIEGSKLNKDKTFITNGEVIAM